MQTQVIFAVMTECPGVPFGTWLDGHDGTELIVIEDALEQSDGGNMTFPEAAKNILMSRQSMAGMVSFRLHAGGVRNHAKQREAVRGIWVDAKEFRTQFNHLSTDGIFLSIKRLADTETRRTTVKSIVTGALNSLVLAEIDHVAAYVQLRMFSPSSVSEADEKRSRNRLKELLADDEQNRAKAVDAFKASGKDVLEAVSSIATNYLDHAS